MSGHPTQAYAELTCRTHYSFLRGAASPEEIINRAAELGLSGIAITDRNGVYGFPKAYQAWKNLAPEARARLKFIVGAELTLKPSCQIEQPGLGPDSIVLLARTRRAYGLLCRMITAAHAGKEKGEAHLTRAQVLEWLGSGTPAQRIAASELIALMPPPIPNPDQARGPDPLPEWLAWIAALDRLQTTAVHVPVFRLKDRLDPLRLKFASRIADAIGTHRLFAANDVHLSEASQKPLQDLMASIRQGTTIHEAGDLLLQNAENRLKSPAEMLALFKGWPEWPESKDLVAQAHALSQTCQFDPSELRYRYPSEWIPEGHSARSYLEETTWKGALTRYGVKSRAEIPPAVTRQLEHELELIAELGFADYFLTIWEIVEFARSRDILCQGRGSAANSAVCYCLGITAIDPVRMNLLFERFISAERGEPPDIDVDFEHERREEVIQHVYQKYGRDRAGMVAALITYRSRSAYREIAKALGVPHEQAREHATVQEYAEQIYGAPRHLSIHSGGFTLSADPIIETVPIEPARMEGRTIVQWDKNDLDFMGLLKVDLLSLGMLSAIKKTLNLIGRELHQIPAEDPATYRMIQRADTVGVFQIESRAQMSMLPRLLPKTFYDLVVEVAIVRPGPIVGKMVHPYLRRKRGLEPVVFPDPKLEPILGRTLGVPLFQEQIMKIAIVLAGFTPGEADKLRRAIGAWRSDGRITEMGMRLMKGLLAHGLPQSFADQIFEQIKGFAEYGFPESHAASFALIAYASAWLKCHHPAEFAASIINSQPMGFYSNSTLIEDARRHGVKILPVCARESEWDCRVVHEAGIKHGAIRLGFTVLHGMSRGEYERLDTARNTERGGRPFASLADFAARSGVKRNLLNQMAMGGVLDCFGLPRREALWQVLGAESRELQDLFQQQLVASEPQPGLFDSLSRWESIEQDLKTTGVFTSGHPVAELRRQNPRLPQLTTQAAKLKARSRDVSVFGLVIVMQRPPTAKGTCFATLEDEEGFLDLIFHKDVFERCRETLESRSFVTVRGELQRSGGRDSHSASLLVSQVL